MSSTCFEHPNVHPQEDVYMQFYGTSLMNPYKHSGRWQDVLCTYIGESKYTVKKNVKLSTPFMTNSFHLWMRFWLHFGISA